MPMLGLFLLQVCLLPLSGLWISQLASAQTPQPKSPSAQNPSTPASSQPALEPKALAILKATSDRLAAAQTMTFTAVSTYESPSRIGPPLVYTTTSDVTLQRPDKLKVISPGDGPPSQFYYDGKTITAFAPNENLVAIKQAPPTIDAALQAAYEDGAVYFPFTDVLVANLYKDITDGLKSAFYVGQSKVIGGTTTDIIAIANDKVFAQVWIGTTDKLPRMIRAVYKDDPSRLRHQVAFSNWKLDVPIAANAFTSPHTTTAKKIEFKAPDPPPAPSTPSRPAFEPPRLTQ
ncbi:DUF2092 domain-containing protein [Neosynechococcus sphagnicola]|nr:DUF2092 domain-containing protein [Neosynechococcus sphagnicola]